MPSDDNLYQRKAGGNWYGRVEVAGKEYRRSLRTRHRAEAKRERDKWIEKLRAQALGRVGTHTWPEAVLKYSTEILDKAVKPSTAKRYRVSFRQVDPFLASRNVEEISRKTLADMIATRSAAGVTNATIRRDLTAIGAVFDGCIVWEWLETNPARDYDRRMVKERRDPIRLPTDEEIAAVLQRAPAGFGNVIRFLEGTGAREDEAVTLDWSEVSIERGEIAFLKTKTNCPRVIRIDDCSPWVSAHLSGTPKNRRKGYVFTHSEGEHYRNFASRFVQIRDRAKASFKCHDLRHLFAVRFLRKDRRRLYDLQKHLGHKSIKTTEIYLAYLPPEAGTPAGT